MAYPVYEDNGGIAAATDDYVDVPYMGTINANDILIVIVGDADNDSFATPADWAKVAEFTATAAFSTAWFWKRATGSETGTERFISALTAGNVVAGVMLRFSGCVTDADPYEAATSAGITQSTSATVSEITTLGADRLCCCLVGVEDNTGTSGGTNYAEVMDVTTATGTDMGFSLFTYQKAAAGLVSAETVTVGGNDFWGTFTFALRDSAPSGYGNTVTGVSSANIDDVIGVATADISKVIGT